MTATHIKPRPVVPKGAGRICTLTGLNEKIYRNELIKLKDIRRALIVNQTEVENAYRSEVFLDVAIISVKIVKFACDLTIGIFTPVGPAGEALGSAYAGAGILVDVLNSPLDKGSANSLMFESGTAGLGATLDLAKKSALSSAVGAASLVIDSTRSVMDLHQEVQRLDNTQASGLALRRRLIASLARVQAKIDDLERALSTCGIS